MTSNISGSKVIIFLCTYQGERFLADQLESFVYQTYPDWQVFASDDKSDDNTLSILESYKRQWPEGKLSVYTGPAEGFVANFLRLTCHADGQADYYAYSDQDDIWEADKLERAVRSLATVPQGVPAAYCSRTKIADFEGKVIGLSALFSKPPCFKNALVQSIGGGNTMVFNNAARILLKKAGENIPAASHDWWVYLLVTGAGGIIFYDSYPSLLYRQHEHNLSGTNITFKAHFRRIRMLWQGDFKKWNECHIAELQKLRNELTPENRKTLDIFAKARHMNLPSRLIFLKKSGVFRQTLLGNLGLFVATVFKKI